MIQCMGARGAYQGGIRCRSPSLCPDLTPALPKHPLLLLFFITLGLESSDTKVYEP